jgi:quercetin dioxygenase-like cupin family protein
MGTIEGKMPQFSDITAIEWGLFIKVSPKSNGSQHLVLLTEEMAPGDPIPTHKHPGQDEILLIEKGSVHVHLGTRNAT